MKLPRINKVPKMDLAFKGSITPVFSKQKLIINLSQFEPSSNSRYQFTFYNHQCHWKHEFVIQPTKNRVSNIKNVSQYKKNASQFHSQCSVPYIALMLIIKW